MKRNLLMMFLTLVLLQMLSCQYEFIDVTSHTDTKIDLKIADKGYMVFKFANNADDLKSDLVLQFDGGKGTTTKVSIYNDSTKIGQDPEKLFTGFELQYDLNKVEFVLTTAESKYIGKGDFFIVISDNKADYSDTFRIFNEVDVIVLQNDHCTNIPKLYTGGKLYYKLANNASNYIGLNKGAATDKVPTLFIKEGKADGKDIPLSDYIKIDPAVTDYFFILSKEDKQEVDPEFNELICVQLLKQRIFDIDDKLVPQQFASSMIFYFKLDLKQFDKDKEENGLLLTIDKTAAEAFSEFGCKYTKADPSEDTLIGLYPKDQASSECGIIKDDQIATSHHLYFKIEDKALDTLLVSVKVKDYHVEIPKLTIKLLPRVVDITDNLESKVDSTILRYYKIDPTKIKDNLIIYTNKENIQSIIYKSLSEKNVVTAPKYHNQIFVVNKDESTDPIYIRLYGTDADVKFEAAINSNKIIYHSGDKRPDSAIPIELKQCKDIAYVIGNYAQNSNSFLSVESLYGKGQVYFLGNITDPSKKISELLPDEKNSDEVVNTFNITTKIDMMKIKCTIPLSININVGPQEKASANLAVGDSFRAATADQEESKYDLTAIDTFGIEARVETPDSEVEVFLNTESKGILNKDNQVFQDSRKAAKRVEGDPYNISFKTISKTGAILSVKLGGGLSVITANETQDQQFLLKPDNTEPFYSGDVTLSSAETGLTICLSTGFHDPQFIPNPKTNCQPFTDNFKIAFNNPYDKYHDQEPSATEEYYIAVHFDKAPTAPIGIAYNYDKKEAASTLDIGKQIAIEKGKSRVRTKAGNDLKQDKLILTFNPCKDQKMTYEMYYDKNQIISGEASANKVDNTDNLFADVDFQFSTDTGVFMYGYGTQADIDGFTPTDKYNIAAALVDSSLTLKIAPFIKGKAVTYDIYVIKSDDQNVAIDTCSLVKSTATKTVTQTNTEDEIEFTIDLTEEGKYQVNINALTVDGIVTGRTYINTEITHGEPVDPDEKSNAWIWILLGCVVAIVVIGGIAYVIYKRKRDNATPQLLEPFDN